MDLFRLGVFSVLLVAVAATAAFCWRQVRLRRDGLLIAAAAVVLLGALLMAGLAALHTGAVVAVALRRSTASGGEGFSYDFRFYSLLLLGAVLLTLAVRCVAAAAGLARGEAGARRRALGGTLGLLAVDAPLIPIQAFAVAFTVLAGLALVALAVAFLRRRVGRSAEEPDRGPGEGR
jgi:hypothetical protein